MPSAAHTRFIIGTLFIASSYYTVLESKKTGIKALHVDFDVSMNKDSASYNSKFSSPQNYKNLEILKSLYAANNLALVKAQQNPRIPLIMHHVWVGPKKLTQTYKKLMREWTSYHPDWRHMFWDDKKVKTLRLRNQALYDAAKNPVEKANILRYEVLNIYGGLYVDMDTKPLRSFDPLHYRYDFYTGICPADCVSLLNNAVIGCAPGHPIIRACINTMPLYVHKRDRVGRNGAMFFSHTFMKTAPQAHGKVIAFPASYFFPLNKNFKSGHMQNSQKKESFCIHYWASGHSAELPDIVMVN